MAEYAYVRVSTKEQKLDRQLADLPPSIQKQNIFQEKESGKNFEDRPIWKTLYSKLQQGDTLYIKSLDRLGRNYDEIGKVWRELSDRGVGMVVLDMPILNTRGSHDLMSRVVTDIVFTLFSYIAENERNSIRKRQREGIDAAKKKGVRFGRPFLPITPKEEATFYAFESGKGSKRGLAEEAGIAHRTWGDHYLLWKNGNGFIREKRSTYDEELQHWKEHYDSMDPEEQIRPRTTKPGKRDHTSYIRSIIAQIDTDYIRSAKDPVEKSKRQEKYFHFIKPLQNVGVKWEQIFDLFAADSSNMQRRYYQWLRMSSNAE